MKVIKTIFDNVLVITPKIFKDDRGALSEIYNDSLCDIINELKEKFCLEYYSTSKINVIRGLHYQIDTLQGKLVSVVRGSIADVVVDMRSNSSTFGKYEIIELNDENKNMIWIPAGFAHGFQSLADNSVLSYKCTGKYSPLHERCVSV